MRRIELLDPTQSGRSAEHLENKLRLQDSRYVIKIACAESQQSDEIATALGIARVLDLKGD